MTTQEIIDHVKRRMLGRIGDEQDNTALMAETTLCDGDHLEIVTLHGGSAIVVALLKRERGFSGRVVCVDPALEQRPLPVDLDSRLELLRREPLPHLPVEPVWPPPVRKELDAMVRERDHLDSLADAGLAPTHSLLFVGPPGVGKTLAARWLAVKLRRTLLTLDLAAVMSSFLGRTGNNIRVVLDFARRAPAVLLLDEFDAIAKRRDDATEVGELKRLVTVLLQAVDDWPEEGVLIAATNHPELLDPAVWRRFDRVVHFPPPSIQDIREVVVQLVGDEDMAKSN